VKLKACVLVVVALIAFGLKRHYADASTDALSWILTPTAYFVGLVTGVTFTAVPGEGYFSAERMFLIEKACAGVNFMIAAFAMVAIALRHRAQSLRGSAAVIVGSLVVSYLAALSVNTLRIVIAMWLASHPVNGSLTGAEIHRLEGIAVYFGGLWLLYAVVRWIDEGSPVFTYALPLCCYYVATLAVPLMNGVQAGRAFVAHAVIVLLVPPALILFVYAVRRTVPTQYRRRNVSAGVEPAHAMNTASGRPVATRRPQTRRPLPGPASQI
jgi:exosortase K